MRSMQTSTCVLLLPVVALQLLLPLVAAATSGGVKHFTAKSGVKPWVDVHTPSDAQSKTSSRGDSWDLVFSDEFNVPDRDFRPGNDYLWPALDLPDGVNAALEYSSPNMTSTLNDTSGRGIFQIKVMQDTITFRVYNAYAKPPAFETHTMYYRSGMVQSWNKFCFQGGRLEVSAQLPGAIDPSVNNPDVAAGDENARVTKVAYYPTWPGIWLMGNLGRALFTKSTNRMWPWSYNECDKDLSPNQRISACDDNPGYGLNKNQGRGAPEIDLLEGGGTDVSTSIQIAPGMPDKFRLIEPDPDLDTSTYCFYSKDCNTKGANAPGIPTATYAKRGYRSWYQGLRYAPNRLCTKVSSQVQTPKTVLSNLEDGITSNTCKGVNTCPASFDGNGNTSLIDGTGKRYWGINDVGGCMPVINGYMGSYLCDPDNSNKKCASPLKDGNEKTNIMEPFNYQMDALSANSGLMLSAYSSYIKYELEWVTGHNGYVRWMIEGDPIYEIPAEALENPPQDSDQTNPRKLMIEEPMYIIFNVALSTSWGAKPPNPGKPCKGDGSDDATNRICSGFPMYLNIDYIRLYQDTSKGSSMAIGCDPASHPTKAWIEGHISEYEDGRNRVIEVMGGAPCFSDDDCTVSQITSAGTTITTGECRANVCRCLSQSAWGGPRCTLALKDSATAKGFGPSLEVALIFGGLAILVTIVVVFKMMKAKRQAAINAAAFSKGITNSNSRQMEELSQSRAPMSKEEKFV
ncbi:TPA: hypothetical protein N0F65_002792 [Lagenidium giganteum]|uniref:Beta-glucan synthesis-associated protein n=1 Tax=Lagenidium giganteum TaxID=4803 RepID=A0AAV2YMN6_9STRA|nr:TPA: hypothetical protein N0F65_002792 [Lagenidium giganteum]